MFWTWEYLRALEGPNDGLVSVESARWGEVVGTLEADHVDLINLFNTWKWEAVVKAAHVGRKVGEVVGDVKESVKGTSVEGKVEGVKEEVERRKEEVVEGLKKEEEKKQFNAIMLYLEIATMLANKGF